MPESPIPLNEDKFFVDFKGPSNVAPDATSRPVIPMSNSQKDPMISGPTGSQNINISTAMPKMPSASSMESSLSSPTSINSQPTTNLSTDQTEMVTNAPSTISSPMPNPTQSAPTALPEHAMHKKNNSMLISFVAIIVVLGIIIGILLYYYKK